MVEDLLSAIKVARFERAFPLWGGSLIKDWIPYLIGQKCPIIVWLDADKLKTSYNIANTLSLVGIETSVVHTEQDPKDLTDAEILKELHGT